MQLSEQTASGSRIIARWQHPAIGRRARFDMTGFLVFVALSYEHNIATGGVSVRPSHADTASKLMSVASRDLHGRLDQGL